MFRDDEGTIAAEEEIVDLAEEVHDLEDSGNDFEECLPSDSKGGRAIPQKEEVTLEDVNEIKYLIFQSCLALLLQKLHFKCHVKSCKEDVTYSMTENGSAEAVTWVNMLTRIYYIANDFLYHEMNVNMSCNFLLL